MVEVHKLYKWFTMAKVAGSSRVIGAALEHAEDPWFGHMIEALLERGTDECWAEVIGQYPRLSETQRLRLAADGEKRRAAIAAAAGNPSVTVRRNAFVAIEEELTPRMGYLIPDALRDPSSEIRAEAAKLLRKLAEMVIAREPGPNESAEERERRREDRREVVQTTMRAFHTLDVHHRVETAEIALWFATDASAEIWQHIDNHRSRTNIVVNEHLHEWNSPRLAAFLISALRRDAWRAKAAEVLSGWNTQGHTVELMRVSYLLDDVETARHLSAVRGRAWFNHIGKDSLLTDEQRAAIPRWVRHVGMQDGERVALLNHLVGADELPVHRAAVYALADLSTNDARDMVRQIADSASPLAAFARWCTLGRDAGLVRSAESFASQQQNARQARWETPPATESDRDFILLWQVCRRTDPSRRGDLIQSFRSNADVWAARIKMHLNCPDPRDRTMALQIISTPSLALRYRHELSELAKDSVEGIARLAAALLKSVQRGAAPTPREADAGDARADGGDEGARRQLRDLLEEMVHTEKTIEDDAAVHRVRDLISRVYPNARHEPEPAGAGA
ncbi:MAG: hypothetical protein ACKVS9_12030 [Phycisphaerae bacterium]